MPKISVIVPSYNCGKFLKRCLESVLTQTHDNLEVVIVDDGSTDDSVSIIQSIHDDRVKILLRSENSGGAAALNTGLEQVTSDFVAICNSDDEWLPGKLEKQLAVMQSCEVAAVFSDVHWIDEQGRIKPESEVPSHNAFAVKNRSRSEWLKALYRGNCLCHPSILIKRSVYDELGFYDNRYRQLPDFDMWLRLVQKHDIFVMPDKFVRFRLRDGGGNTSSVSVDNSTRDANEQAFILDKFFRELSLENFLGAFGCRKAPNDPGFCLMLEKVFFLATEPFKCKNLLKHIALKLLHEFMAADDSLEKLAAYDENFQSIYCFSGIFSPFSTPREMNSLSFKEKQKLMDWAGFQRLEAIVPHFVNYLYASPVEESVDHVAANEKLNRKLAAARLEIKERDERISDFKSRVRKLEGDLSLTASEKILVEKQLTAKEEQSSHLMREIAELRAALSEIASSKSWRLTAPIRKLRRKTSNSDE